MLRRTILTKYLRQYLACVSTVCLALLAPDQSLGQCNSTTTFSYTGSAQTWTVPSGVSSISVDLFGAAGGLGSVTSTPAGNGGEIKATMAVTPGQVLYFYVGGKGSDYSSSSTSAGGFNGGGDGGSINAGAGGGASDIRVGGTALSNRVIVAGAGGGAGYVTVATSTGNGGGSTGETGGGGGGAPGCGGVGGSQSSGGAGGTEGGGACAGGNGSLGTGGAGASDNTHGGGGGGGAGYYGGGGGEAACSNPINHRGCGGGGSSYYNTSYISSVVTNSTGGNSGNGKIVIGYTVSISGSSSVCTGSTITLSSPIGGGTWASSNGNATVGASTGVVTGVTAGTSVISYTASGCTSTKTVTINAGASISVGSVSAICSGSSVGLSASGGSTYSWSPATALSATAGASVTANPTTTTTYTVTGVNGSGCSGTASVAVSVNPAPAVSAGTGSAICNGSAASLTATGGTTYSWAPATGLSATTGASVSASPSVTTTYTVTGTNGSGCSNTSPVVVTVNAAPSVTTGTGPSICAGGSGVLTASGASAYSWAPGTGLSATTGASVTASPSSTTIYTVTGTTAGCSSTATVTVTVSSFSGISAGADAAICSGASTTLTATGGVTYSWAPATGLSASTGATVSASPAGTTTYTVTGTNGSGCSGTSTVTVTVSAAPSVSAGAGAAYCGGSSAGLTATGATSYTWAPATGLSATTGAGVTASPTVTTTYTVTGSNGPGCSATATVTITVNAVPAVGASGAAVLCSGISTSLSATGATTYSWVPGTGLSATTGATITATPASTTTYTVTGTTAGCSNTATWTITVNAAPSITSMGNGGAICAGGTLTLNASGTGIGTILYAWSGPASFTSTLQNPSIPSATTAAAGTYTLTLTDASGCAAAGTNVTVCTVNALASPTSITGANGICVGSTTTLSAGTAGGTWSVGNALATVGSGTGVVTGVGIGIATVSYSYTDINSCSNVATKSVEILGAPAYIYTFVGNGVNASTGDGGPSYMASIRGPRALCADTSGSLYVCDVTANVVRKVTASGVITTVAGNGTAGSGGDGGQATAAQLNMVGGAGVYLDKAGNMYIACTGTHTIRKVTASTGIISTIAGTGVAGYLGDGGPASAAKINAPMGICQDTSGNIYFADQSNQRVRKIDAVTKVITTVAGNGSNYYSGDGGQGTAARLSYPRDVACDNSGNLYIADGGNNVIRKYVIATGIITTIAGTGVAGDAGDGGQATAAKFNCPARIAYDGGIYLYVADQNNNKIKKINLSTGIIRTSTANGTSGFSGDGGPSLSANISCPAGLAFNRTGHVYIADANNRRVRLAPFNESIMITLAGPATVSTGTPVTFTAKSSITTSYSSLQWQKNGTNVGSGASTYTDSSPASGDVYRCLLVVSPDCGSTFYDTSNSITITVSASRQALPALIGGVEMQGGVELYPNPVSGQCTLIAQDMENGPAAMVIYDQVGKVVYAGNTEVADRQLKEIIDARTFAQGIYLISVKDNAGKMIRLKFVKN